MCQLLNNRDEYYNLCEFQPKLITDGGILFKSKNNLDNKRYNSVRLSVKNESKVKWYWINYNCLSAWTGNNDIIFDKNIIFTSFLKSFYGAPLFTIDELEIWEECFNQIGVVNVDKYPSKQV